MSYVQTQSKLRRIGQWITFIFFYTNYISKDVYPRGSTFILSFLNANMPLDVSLREWCQMSEFFPIEGGSVFYQKILNFKNVSNILRGQTSLILCMENSCLAEQYAVWLCHQASGITYYIPSHHHIMLSCYHAIMQLSADNFIVKVMLAVSRVHSQGMFNYYVISLWPSKVRLG